MTIGIQVYLCKCFVVLRQEFFIVQFDVKQQLINYFTTAKYEKAIFKEREEPYANKNRTQQNKLLHKSE